MTIIICMYCMLRIHPPKILLPPSYPFFFPSSLPLFRPTHQSLNVLPHYIGHRSTRPSQRQRFASAEEEITRAKGALYAAHDEEHHARDDARADEEHVRIQLREAQRDDDVAEQRQRPEERKAKWNNVSLLVWFGILLSTNKQIKY